LNFFQNKAWAPYLSTILNVWSNVRLIGPLTFIVLIDDLSTGYLMHKLVDDSTLSEIIGKDGMSQMEINIGDVLNWSALNLMNINITKTK